MKKENNVFLGIICSILGSFVGALPWLLVYMAKYLIIGLLSTFIAIGAYGGYKISKNKIDKKFPPIIYFSTILTVTICYFIVIPILGKVAVSAIVIDYLISLGMALIGAVGVINTVKNKEHDKEKYGTYSISSFFNNQSILPEEAKKVKKAFKDNSAMEKEKAVLREKIISDLSKEMDETRASQVFNLIKDEQIIRKYKGKFYYSEKAENDELYRNSRLLAITLILSTIIIALIVAFKIFMKSNIR